jgi:hypothetical protein
MFKKVVVGVVISAMNFSAFAAKFDVDIQFNDGTTKRYTQLDDGPNALQLLALQVQQDFPGKNLNELVSVTSRPSETGYTQTVSQAYQPKAELIRNQYQSAPPQEAKSSGMSWQAWAAAFGLIAVSVALAKGGGSGGCQHYNDRAKDGSLCGKRSADYRPGGR